jgi:hypothetical protein
MRGDSPPLPHTPSVCRAWVWRQYHVAQIFVEYVGLGMANVVVNTPASFLGGSGFKCLPGDWLS